MRGRRGQGRKVQATETGEYDWVEDYILQGFRAATSIIAHAKLHSEHPFSGVFVPQTSEY
jgi:hypothetical protein